MNEQDHSDSTILQDQNELKQQNSIDSNGSDSSSSQIKIVLIKDKNDDSNQLNDELNNDNIVNEQRESVIVQPTRPNIIAEITAKKPKIDNKDKIESKNDDLKNSTQKDERPKFFFESKFSPSLINNLVNTVTKDTTKFRPSVLRIGDSSTNKDDKDIDSTNKDEQIKVQPFKFAPLTDNKKPSFGNLNNSSIISSSSILPTSSSLSGLNSSSIFSSSSNCTPTSTTFKNSFLTTNNGDSKATSTSTNYFTENLFQAAASTSNNSPESTSTFSISSNNESTGFVFGQNLQDRVTNIVEKPKQSVDSNASTTATISQTDSTNIASTSTSLNNQAATACIPEKRKFENITGEEEETNVIHIYCKLFHWDSKSSVWKERGKGNLRLNDKYEERTSSRLIMRTAGSLKLILNCLIQSGMKFELTSENSCIRFSNVDGIYLIKGKPTDIEQIYLLIEQRLKQLPKKSRAESKDVEDGLEIKERLKLNKDDDDDESLNTSNTSNREAEESFKSTESTNKEEDENSNEENKDDEDDNDEGNKEEDDNKEEDKNDEHDNDENNDEEIKTSEEADKEKIKLDVKNNEINKQENDGDDKKSNKTNQES